MPQHRLWHPAGGAYDAPPDLLLVGWGLGETPLPILVFSMPLTTVFGRLYGQEGKSDTPIFETWLRLRIR